MSRTAHQNSCKIYINNFFFSEINTVCNESTMLFDAALTVIHSLRVERVSVLNSRFFNLASGPSASTARHLRKTSQ